MPTTELPRRPTTWVGPLSIEYDDHVLMPRPWTSAQSAWAAGISDELAQGPLLELCSGVGHIGLLAARLTGRAAVLVDSNLAACRLAERNATRNGLAERVTVRCGPVDSTLEPHEQFPLVLVDPPYIPSAETGRFPEDPLTAIDGGTDGLEVAISCLGVAARHLAADGAVILQLRDAAQADRLAAQLVTLDVAEVRVVGDHGALVRLGGAR